MLFGLSNAPSTFMRLMNEVLRLFIGKFVVAYVDDILVYSRDKVSHVEHLFQVLTQQKLYAKLEKCKIFTPQVIFIGYVVSGGGIQVDEYKVEAIKIWSIPTSIMEIRSFHGLTSLYRQFFKDLSFIIAPLPNARRKKVLHGQRLLKEPLKQ